MKKSVDQDSRDNNIKVAAKRVYSKPQLLRYGSVIELTKGAGKSFNDTPSKRA